MDDMDFTEAESALNDLTSEYDPLMGCCCADDDDDMIEEEE